MPNTESNFWPFNFDQIEDRTRKNYYALLPKEDSLKEELAQVLIINKPAGTVGGDGFWSHTEDDILFLALFDCVGQGHLASMMTRIYSNALHKLIVENSIQYPASVIQFIHREIKTKFSDKEKIKLNTGADLGILRIDKSSHTIEFAGAKMDLIIISPNSTEIIKGDGLHIGEHFDEKHDFHSTSVNINSQSKIYLHTDGVIDLMGGTDYKKMGTARFYEFLTSICHLDLDEQKGKINVFLRDWSGEHPQNDDILIIGFSLQPI